MSEFSKRFKNLREMRRLTQDQVADILGISRSTVAGYESNDKSRVPREENMKKIADLFGTSIDYLMGRGDSTFEIFDANLPDVKKEMIEKVLTMTEEDAKFISDMYDRMKK